MSAVRRENPTCALLDGAMNASAAHAASFASAAVTAQ